MLKLDTQFILDYLMPNEDGQWAMYELLNEFNKTFEPSDDPALWFGLIKEEAFEWLEEYVNEGITPNTLKEYCDILYVLEGFSRLFEANEVEITGYCNEEQQKVLLQILWSAANISLTTWTTEEIIEGFERVHKSNMSKLTEDGKVLRREDGKVLKSDQYLPPDLSDLVKGTEFLDKVRKMLDV